MIKENKNLYDVIVIGGGPAGLSAALYLARACYKVLVIEKEKFGGQITLTTEVVNYPGVPTIDGNGLTSSMRRQAESFGAEFLIDEVTSVDLNQEIKIVSTKSDSFQAYGVLIATGAKPRKLGFKGEDEFQGRGIAYCATCDGEFFTGKDVFVIGGGFAAAEESVYLTKFANSVTILMRGDDFSCAKSIADEAKENPKIKVKHNCVVDEVSGDEMLRKIVYKNTKTGEIINYEDPKGNPFGVFSFAGYIPATSLFKDIVSMSEQNYILTDKQQKTNIDGVYAAGDVCDKNLRQVVTAVGDGAVAATELEKHCSKMRKKMDFVPQIQKKAAHHEPKSDANISSDTELFSKETVEQLNSVFEKMENPLILSVSLNDSDVSKELRTYMEELSSLSSKLILEINDEASNFDDLPVVRLLKEDRSYTGLAFHGVPGGHEFKSFVLGLYNASGNGQKISEDSLNRIKAISDKVEIKIVVSLHCTMCPDLVIAAQKIASLNDNISAEVYDDAHFPKLREEYNIMSVPCMIINGTSPKFGRKNIEQILDLLEA